MTTIKKQLDNASDILANHSLSPRLDAEVLLAFVLGKNRSYLRAWDDKQLEVKSLELFVELVEKRSVGVPVAYLTGQREFWSRDFKVSPAVLIPRPETELLIELCLESLSSRQKYAVLDLGTGSGAIAVTLAAERPLVEILSNPPYIAQDDVHLSQGDVRFEPMSALVAEDKGLGDIKRIANDAKKHLRPGGQLWFEHGYNQARETQEILKELNYKDVKTYFDLSGQPRVTMGFI